MRRILHLSLIRLQISSPFFFLPPPPHCNDLYNCLLARKIIVKPIVKLWVGLSFELQHATEVLSVGTLIVVLSLYILSTKKKIVLGVRGCTLCTLLQKEFVFGNPGETNPDKLQYFCFSMHLFVYFEHALS